MRCHFEKIIERFADPKFGRNVSCTVVVSFLNFQVGLELYHKVH